VSRLPKFHFSLSDSATRVVESFAPIIQIIAAALAGYSIAHFGLGHAAPLLAVTVAITALGFTRDARPRRVAETAVGMIVGIALSEMLLLAFGRGLWQMALVLLICLTAARFISDSASFALTVAIQAMLVHILDAPEGGVFVRSIDGIVGGLTALIFTAIIPRDPRRIARRDAQKLFDMFIDSMRALTMATRHVDERIVDDALVKVRRSQPLIDNWRLSLDSAVAVARISPFLRKHRGELTGQLRLMRGMDLATRNLRVVVRRVDFLVKDGEARPYLADLFEQIADAAELLSAGIAEPAKLREAQRNLVYIIHQLDPKRFGIADQLREASVLLLLRPMLVDLLCASGMSEDDARAELPIV
jgi:uncharacterized membrane protein YgaE (UPF0421/DUF939 family)